MNIECCVCDMDGTLLNSRRELSEANVVALRQLQEQGVQVVLATGRTDLYVKEVAHRLQITAPVISCNGGMVRRLTDGEVLYHKYFPQEVDRQLAAVCLEQDYDCLVYSADKVYYRQGSERIKVFQNYNERVQPDFRAPLEAFSKGDDLPLGRVLKFFIWSLQEVQQLKLREQFENTGQLSMVISEKAGFDIMAQGISKGAALQFLSEKMGFSLAKTAVFGDNYNDISMLKLAGYSIAMGNGETAVKQAAKFVTCSNDEDGVAVGIRQFLLSE